jgi:hypothetical protein
VQPLITVLSDSFRAEFQTVASPSIGVVGEKPGADMSDPALWDRSDFGVWESWYQQAYPPGSTYDPGSNEYLGDFDLPATSGGRHLFWSQRDHDGYGNEFGVAGFYWPEGTVVCDVDRLWAAPHTVSAPTSGEMIPEAAFDVYYAGVGPWYDGEHGTLYAPYSGELCTWLGDSFTASGPYEATAVTHKGKLYGFVYQQAGTLTITGPTADGTGREVIYDDALFKLAGDHVTAGSVATATTSTPWLRPYPLMPDFPREGPAQVHAFILRPRERLDKAGTSWKSTLTTPPPWVMAGRVENP